AERLSGDSAQTLEADRAQIEAAERRAARRPVVENLELRLNQIGLEDGVWDPDFDVAIRLPLENPREVAAERDTRVAEVEVAISQYGRAELDLAVRSCESAALAHFTAIGTDIASAQSERAGLLSVWLETLYAEGVLSELDYHRLRLTLDEAQIRPSGPAMDVEAPSSEDTLERFRSARITTADAVLRLVSENHPDLSLDLAQAELSRSRAREERAQNAFHLEFVEIGYRPLGPRGAEEIHGQLAVDFGWAGATRRDAEYLTLQANALDLGARQRASTLAAEAAPLLAQLNSFSARIPAIEEAWRHADSAEAILDRTLDEGSPRATDLIGLWSDIYAIRRQIADQFLDADQTACELLRVTGVSIDNWPTR
ncbi:MAG: hypothetical protein KC561_04520, partial [Myxococcales bacterium]|nr:hypothetical protein [Myxococcales bacterium]